MTTISTSTGSGDLKHQEIRHSQEFVEAVQKLCRDKGTRADLRSGLGLPPNRCFRMSRYLVRFTTEKMRPETVRSYYAIAALIAARPRVAREVDEAGPTSPVDVSWGRRRRTSNLGVSLAQGVRKEALSEGSAEGDLHLFTRQSSDAVYPRLPALTRHLLTARVSVDWAVLLEDLVWWDRYRDDIATRWLDGYFRARYSAEAADPDHEKDHAREDS